MFPVPFDSPKVLKQGRSVSTPQGTLIQILRLGAGKALVLAVSSEIIVSTQFCRLDNEDWQPLPFSHRRVYRGQNHLYSLKFGPITMEVMCILYYILFFCLDHLQGYFKSCMRSSVFSVLRKTIKIAEDPVRNWDRKWLDLSVSSAETVLLYIDYADPIHTYLLSYCSFVQRTSHFPHIASKFWL